MRKEDRQFILGLAAVVIAIVALVGLVSGLYTIGPGMRGVVRTFGRVSDAPAGEGLHVKWPLVSHVERVPVKQVSMEASAPCFSSDLQQVDMQIRLLVRYPEAKVVTIYRDYQGSVADLVVIPKMQEALKEVTAGLTAEQIVKQREQVKAESLDGLRKKMADLVVIDDLVIENIDLTDQLEQAIEQKMVQEQQAAKAKFVQAQAEVDAKTAVIRAQGEAEAIRIRAEALANNPAVIDMAIVEKWDGKSPLYVGGGAAGAGILLPARVEGR